MERARGDLEKALVELARRGLLELPVTDELVAAFETHEKPEDLSQEEFRKLYNRVRETWQDLALEKARQELVQQAVPFGTLVQMVRTNAGLNVTEMAARLKKEAVFLERLEANLINPLEIPPKTLCDVMEAFRLTVSELVRSTQESLILFSESKGSIRAMARSPLEPGTKDRGESIAQAVSALFIEKAKREGKALPPIDAQFQDLIRQELGARGRTDLLV